MVGCKVWAHAPPLGLSPSLLCNKSSCGLREASSDSIAVKLRPLSFVRRRRSKQLRQEQRQTAGFKVSFEKMAESGKISQISLLTSKERNILHMIPWPNPIKLPLEQTEISYKGDSQANINLWLMSKTKLVSKYIYIYICLYIRDFKEFEGIAITDAKFCSILCPNKAKATLDKIFRLLYQTNYSVFQDW